LRRIAGKLSRGLPIPSELSLAILGKKSTTSLQAISLGFPYPNPRRFSGRFTTTSRKERGRKKKIIHNSNYKNTRFSIPQPNKKGAITAPRFI
jgi:hypothetical protein